MTAATSAKREEDLVRRIKDVFALHDVLPHLRYALGMVEAQSTTDPVRAHRALVNWLASMYRGLTEHIPEAKAARRAIWRPPPDLPPRRPKARRRKA
jgi:hypothetical protein